MFGFGKESHYVIQVYLKILNSGTPSASTSQGVGHRGRPAKSQVFNGHTSLPFSSRTASVGGVVQSKHIIKRYIISHEVMVTAYTNDILARDEDLSDLSSIRYHL